MAELDLFEATAWGPRGEDEGGYALVAPEAPVDRAYTYLVPAALKEQAQVGVRVRVPFRGRSLRGFLLALPAACDVDPARLRPLEAVLDAAPVVTPEVLALARWAASYYRAALGEVLAAAIPKAVGAPPRGRNPRGWVWRSALPLDGRLGKAQRAALALLEEGPRPLAELRAVGAGVLRRLEERGLIATGERPPPAGSGGGSAPAGGGDGGSGAGGDGAGHGGRVPASGEGGGGEVPPELTAEQQLALAPLLAQLDRPEHVTTLLFGITGSGKTEVYLRAIARVLELGRAAIVLVPEISLTPQTLQRFRARFGAGVAILHSRMPGYDRRSEWLRVQRGEARVVIGPRSAVWAPAQDLGLIVVDEEHDGSYKQENAPRYHARDLAVVRAQQAGIPIVLGSATPSLESYHNARRGRYRLARLRARPGGSTLPGVEVVDMGREWSEVKGAPLISRALLGAMERALPRGERVLLLQNRRGFATYLQCRACGHVLQCRQCDIALTYHRHEGATVCHFCDERRPPPGGACPACMGPPLKQQGAGTERIEDIVQRLFPTAAVGRLDTDVVRGGDSAEAVLARFARGELNVLVGTQMVAKGLDIPEVTVVGVISADTSLALPDFRSSERCFQLIAQVAGRAGRGARAGTTVVQTFSPEHFAIRTAAAHDFEAFAADELRHRQALRYPPFARLLKVLVRGPEEGAVQGAAEQLAQSLRATCSARPDVLALLGPAPSPRAFLAGKYRWQLLLKATAPGVRHLLGALAAIKPVSKIERLLDVDPHHLI